MYDVNYYCVLGVCFMVSFDEFKDNYCLLMWLFYLDCYVLESECKVLYVVCINLVYIMLC